MSAECGWQACRHQKSGVIAPRGKSGGTAIEDKEAFQADTGRRKRGAFREGAGCDEGVT